MTFISVCICVYISATNIFWIWVIFNQFEIGQKNEVIPADQEHCWHFTISKIFGMNDSD